MLGVAGVDCVGLAEGEFAGWDWFALLDEGSELLVVVEGFDAEVAVVDVGETVFVFEGLLAGDVVGLVVFLLTVVVLVLGIFADGLVLFVEVWEAL